VDAFFSLYTICEILADGSSGKVFRAIRRADKVVVAIKIVHVSVDRNKIVESQQEVLALKMLLGSQFVVRYHESFLHTGSDDTWIVLEFCSGGSLAFMMEVVDRTLTEPELRAVVTAVLRGLRSMHEMRIIHRDVRAGHILMDDAGQVKLADFGLSAELTKVRPRRNSVVGSAFWMAPEVILDSLYDEKAGLFSVFFFLFFFFLLRLFRNEFL